MTRLLRLDHSAIAQQQLDAPDPLKMRQALLTPLSEMTVKDELLARESRDVAFRQTLIEKFTHEFASLRRPKYAVPNEILCAGIGAKQESLIEVTLNGDAA